MPRRTQRARAARTLHDYVDIASIRIGLGRISDDLAARVEALGLELTAEQLYAVAAIVRRLTPDREA